MEKIKVYLKAKFPTIVHYLVSSIITFLTAFLGMLILVIDKFTLESFETGAWVGVVVVAIRAGVKALLESWLQNKFKMN